MTTTIALLANDRSASSMLATVLQESPYQHEFYMRLGDLTGRSKCSLIVIDSSVPPAEAQKLIELTHTDEHKLNGMKVVALTAGGQAAAPAGVDGHISKTDLKFRTNLVTELDRVMAAKKVQPASIIPAPSSVALPAAEIASSRTK